MRRLLLSALLLGFALPAAAQDEPPEVTRIRKSVPRLKKALVELRKLPFKREVTVHYQSDADFRKFVLGELEKELPDAKAAEISRLYLRLGLVPKGYDLKKSFTDLFASQALAYYNPKTDAFYVLKTKMPAMMIDPSVLHELQHAIQDQHFGLDKLTAMAETQGEDDRVTALKFLFEGEATYLMTVYSVKNQGLGADMAETQIRMIANLDREQMAQMERAQLPMLGEAGKSMKSALDARDKAPRYLYRTLVDPYYKGAAMVMAVKKHGGWKAIDALFRNPPTSTEQVLHPEKLMGERDEPTPLGLPDLASAFGAGWSKCQSNCLGELGFQTVFRDQLGDAQSRACAGWDGDKIQSYEVDGAKKAATVWVSTWDSVKDAREFASAYKKLLFKKYGQSALKVKEGVLAFAKDGEEHLMTLRGQDVLVIEGAPVGKARGIMDAALAGLKRGSEVRKSAPKPAAPKPAAPKPAAPKKTPEAPKKPDGDQLKPY